jgi:single-stranded DNA-specific DHH superfamily exonuclease
MRQEAVDFLNSLKDGDKVKIFSHVDADGICSLVILLRFMKRKGLIREYGSANYQLTDVPPITLETAKRMIFADLNSDTICDYINENSLVIDHHIFDKRPKGAFYNPRETDKGLYIPASYLIYEVCRELQEMEDTRWIAAVGVIGDKGELNSKICRDFVDSFDNFDQLQKVADFIYSVYLIDGNTGNDKMVKALLEAKKPEDILEDPYFKFCFDEVQTEISRSSKKIEKDGIVRFVEVKSRYNIKSIVAAQILEKEKNIVVVTYSTSDGFCKMSLRTDTNLNIGNITKKAAEKAKGSGGGHEKAAGARVLKTRFSIFKEAFVSGVENIVSVEKK